jgi:hypothetical protein
LRERHVAKATDGVTNKFANLAMHTAASAMFNDALNTKSHRSDDLPSEPGTSRRHVPADQRVTTRRRREQIDKLVELKGKNIIVMQGASIAHRTSDPLPSFARCRVSASCARRRR